MTDYKTHLEKFVSDIYKKFDEEKEKRDSLKIIDRNYEKIQKQLDELVKAINKPKVPEQIQIIDNNNFIDLMGISQKTAQSWRDTGVVSFSQVGNKIYYKISDVQELINLNYHKAKVKGGKKK
ncbi:MAG: helix-turn-helix domain-containing protein [Bacteroidales bacterium]|jgi:hypothetical protein